MCHFRLMCRFIKGVRGQKWFPMMLDYVKVKTVECLPLVMESKHAILVRVKVKVLDQGTIRVRQLSQ